MYSLPWSCCCCWWWWGGGHGCPYNDDVITWVR